ncbi:MAG: 3-oxoacyl-[acyl-carrier protein] reductase [Actinomycetota bacterium]|jgi:3-oxoacyl-[acyl-carrier protein] reductase
MDLGLGGRAAIVTGASRGIGRATAIGLAAEGCDVLLCGRDDAALAEVTREISAHDRSGRAEPVHVDVEAVGAAEAIVAECQRVFGRIDILVNNAGGTSAQFLHEVQADDWQSAFDRNFFSAARLAVAAANAMRPSGWGRLVHVSSIDGIEADKAFAAYSAAKAAMLNLSKSLSQEYARDGVLSNCVVPGITITESVMDNAAAAAQRSGSTADEVLQRMLERQRVNVRRFGQPNEIADAIVFLASERATFITGAALAIDGGTLRSI